MRMRPRGIVATAMLAVLWLLNVAVSPAAASCPPPSGDAYSAAVLSDSPIAYYRLDEASGPTLCDSSSSAANGTYKAGVSFGVSGALLSSPDTAVRVTTPSEGIGDGGPGVVGNHSFTLEGWYRSTGTTQTQVLVDMGTGGAGNIAGLGVTDQSSGSSVLLDTFDGVVYWPSGAVNLFDQQWHYLATTYDQATGQVTAYLDGRDLGPKTPPHPIHLLPSAIRLGWWIDTFLNHLFVGDADEIAVYPSALSPARVFAHFAASRPGAAANASSPGNSVLITVPRLTCAGICHVILVRVRVLGPGQVAVEEALAAGAGRLAVTARRAKHTRLINPARVTVASAGAIEVPLRLTAAAQKLLRTKGKLALKLRVGFTPRGGRKITKAVSFTVRP